MMKAVLFLAVGLLLVGSVLADADTELIRSQISDQGSTVVMVVYDGGIGAASSDARQSLVEGVRGRLGKASTFDIIQEYVYSKAFAVRIDDAAFSTLLATPGVRVAPDKPLHYALQDTVPMVRANAVWNRTVSGVGLTGRGMSVCIIDGGIDYAHPAFAGRIVASRCTLPSGCPDPGNLSLASDEDSHGTWVAGIVAANGSQVGVAPQSDLVIVKACSPTDCPTSAVTAGVEWCVNNSVAYNITAISLSLGDGSYNSVASCPMYTTEYTPLTAAINAAWAHGIPFVASSGNSGGVGVAYPSCMPNATSVGAVDIDDTMMWFTQTGALLDMVAPGNHVNTTNLGGGYQTLTGTSASAPFVAGTAALLAQYVRLRGGTVIPGQLETALMNGSSVRVSGVPRLDALGSYLFLSQNITFNTSAHLVQKRDIGSVNFSTSVDLGAFDQCGVISDNLVSIDSARCPQYNVSATLRLSNLLFTKAVPLRDGAFCTDCVVDSYNGGELRFSVPHFTTYAAGAATNLTMWDSTDAGMPFGGLTKRVGDMVTFYANFTNATGQPANTADGGCQIDFAAPSYDGFESMTYNSTLTMYAFSRSFGSAGTLSWKVSCSGQGDSVTAEDTVLINPAKQNVPEFSDVAAALALVVVVSGIVALRRTK